MKRIVLDNRKQYLQRKEIYKSFGYDIDKERNDLLEKIKPITGDVLEIGTGKGHLTMFLAKENCQLTTVDISKEEQNYALLNLKYLKLDKDINFKIADAQNLPFDSKSFDLVICSNTLHHLSSLYPVLDQFCRVVKDDGKIAISDFNEQGFLLVEKVHHKEGRKHSKGVCAVSDAEKYFRKKKFSVETYNMKNQSLIVVQKKGIK